MKLWWTQSCAGNSPASRWRWSNDHDLQRSFPTNRSVSLWVRTWAAQERKIKTVVAEELHRGQVKGRKHSEFRAAGSHTAVADISDKHTGPKGKKKEKTPTQNTKSTNRMRYRIESYKGKLSYKVTPSPKLSYCSYFKYLLSLIVLKASKKSPSSSGILTWSQLHMNGGSAAKHKGCLSVSGSACPAHSTAQYTAAPISLSHTSSKHFGKTR